MSEQLFDVVFYGILQQGKDKDVVMQNMATLFKTDVSKLAPYFSGGRKVIKGKINADTVTKYQSALENIGLVIKVEECDDTQTTSEAAAEQQNESEQEATDSNDEHTFDTSGISVAPVGADIIENPQEVDVQKIDDIRGISVAEPGADIIENPVPITPQKIEGTDAISMAEVGSDIMEHEVEVIAQKIDNISDISLAEVGADVIENPRPKEIAPVPDTSELSLDDNNA